MKHLLTQFGLSVGLASYATVGSPSADRRRRQLKHITFMLLFLLGSLNVWGEMVEFNYSNTSWTTTAGAQSTTISGINISTTNGIKNTSNSDFRSYSGATLTVSATSATITEIVFTYSNKDITAASVGTWTKSSKTWTGSANSIDFTQDGQVRITKAIVTYTSSGSPETTD